MRARAQDQVCQRGRVVADGRCLTPDALVRPIPAAPPFRILKSHRRQRQQRRPVEPLEQRSPGCAEAAHGAVVQLPDQPGDRAVQLGKGEKPLVAQPCQDPALHDLDADLHLGLVARLVGPGRHDGRTVVRRHLAIGPVHRRLVEAGAGDARLEIVADQLTRHAAEIAERPHMRADPVRQPLAPGRAGKGEARRAEHRDKDRRLALLPACPLHDRHRAASIVHEQTLARRMHLAQRRLQPAGPLAIQVAKPSANGYAVSQE